MTLRASLFAELRGSKEGRHLLKEFSSAAGA